MYLYKNSVPTWMWCCVKILTLETLCQNEHWTFTTKRQSKTRPNTRSNISRILEDIIHKLLEGNISSHTIMTSTFVRRNYNPHKSKNKWITPLIKQKINEKLKLLALKTRAYPNATRHENFKSVDGELETLQEEPQSMQKEGVVNKFCPLIKTRYGTESKYSLLFITSSVGHINVRLFKI